MANEKNNGKIVFQIRAHLGEISNRKEGWKKELNLVSWNGQEPPKFDIRDWSEDHTKMGRGITLYDDEMRRVTQYYTQFCNAKIISESKNSRNAAAQAGLKAGEEIREKADEAAGMGRDTGSAQPANQGSDSADHTAAEDMETAGSDEINDASFAAENKVRSNDKDDAEDYNGLDGAELAGLEAAGTEQAAEQEPF